MARAVNKRSGSCTAARHLVHVYADDGIVDWLVGGLPRAAPVFLAEG